MRIYTCICVLFCSYSSFIFLSSLLLTCASSMKLNTFFFYFYFNHFYVKKNKIKKKYYKGGKYLNLLFQGSLSVFLSLFSLMIFLNTKKNNNFVFFLIEIFLYGLRYKKIEWQSEKVRLFIVNYDFVSVNVCAFLFSSKYRNVWWCSWRKAN